MLSNKYSNILYVWCNTRPWIRPAVKKMDRCCTDGSLAVGSGRCWGTSVFLSAHLLRMYHQVNNLNFSAMFSYVKLRENISIVYWSTHLFDKQKCCWFISSYRPFRGCTRKGIWLKPQPKSSMRSYLVWWTLVTQEQQKNSFNVSEAYNISLFVLIFLKIIPI